MTSIEPSIISLSNSGSDYGCLCSWKNHLHVSTFSLYNKMKENKEAFNYLMSSSNPRHLFATFCIQILDDNNSTNAILNSTCRNGHAFSSFAGNIISSFFNVMAKNYVSHMHDTIHAGKKRNGKVQITGCSSNAMKIRKLTSN